MNVRSSVVDISMYAYGWTDLCCPWCPEVHDGQSSLVDLCLESGAVVHHHDLLHGEISLDSVVFLVAEQRSMGQFKWLMTGMTGMTTAGTTGRFQNKTNVTRNITYIGRFGLCTGHWTKAAWVYDQNSVAVMWYEMAKRHETLFQHLGLQRQPYIRRLWVMDPSKFK